MRLSEILELGVIGTNNKTIEVGATVRHMAFVERDGPKHTGTVEKIMWYGDRPPIVVVNMEDGRTEHWVTAWTSNGPWSLHAPFKTQRGKAVAK